MRLLLSSFSAACNGSYGIVTREIFKRIKELDPGIEIIQHGWLHNKPLEEVPWEIVPTENNVEIGPDGRPYPDSYGERTLQKLLDSFRPHMLWQLGDPWMGINAAMLKPQYGYRYIYYIPVDSEPYSPVWNERINMADEVIAMSDYGVDVLSGNQDLRSVNFSSIPLGVDTTIFHPLDKEDIKSKRSEFSEGKLTKNMKVLGWIGRDQPRKQNWQLYELLHYIRTGEWILCKECGRITVKEYDHVSRLPRDITKLRKYECGYKYEHCWYCHSKDIVPGTPREDVVLWTHMFNQPDTGWDLDELLNTYRIREEVYDPSGHVGDGEISPEDMNWLYNCFDVFVYPTGGEGFGMPILEAMAAGIPCVYANYSAYTDWAVGESVRVEIFQPEIRTQRCRALIDMGEMVRKTLLMLNDHNRRSIFSKRGMKAASKFSWDEVAQHWMKMIESVHCRDSAMVYGEVI